MMLGTRCVIRAVLLAVLLFGTLTLGEVDPVHGAVQLEVVAHGLDSPRGLAFDNHDNLLVAEAGRGGTGPCNVGPTGETFCVGRTGAITAVRNGQQSRVVTRLPSYGNLDGDFVLGPHDVGVATGGAEQDLPGGISPLRVTLGLGLHPSRRSELGTVGADLGKLVRITGPTMWRTVADLAAYELANNPDAGNPGSAVDSDPFGLLQEGPRSVVTDAGGNDLLTVTPTGQVTTTAVFPVVPDPATGALLDAVPTGVARGPDGALYVGELTGFPYPPGQAQVFRVVPGQAPKVVAGGFTNIIDITFDHQGRLIVLEIATHGLTSGDPTGALKRVEANGAVTVLAQEGLVHPGGVVLGPDGAFYISNRSTSIGTGEVLRLQV